MIGQEERDAVQRVLGRGVLSGYQGNYSKAFYGGQEVKALEQEWQEYFSTRNAIFVNSATSGLWAACAVLNLKPGDEILCVPYSMTCSASIPLQFGAKPIFVDIEKEYFCMDPEKIEEKITDKTRAIIAVNLFGLPADYDRINTIARKHNLTVIEDAAQAIGAKYKGNYAGTLSDIGVFSLNRNKHINCGEGGVITTNDDSLAFRLRAAVNHSEAVVNDMERQDVDGWQRYVSLWPGMNLRGTELSAAVAREQLKKLEGIVKTHQEHAECFPVRVRPDCEHSFYRYAWTLALSEFDPGDKYNMKRHYIKPIYQMPLFQHLGYPDGLCPVCESVEENIVLAWLKDVV